MTLPHDNELLVNSVIRARLWELIGDDGTLTLRVDSSAGVKCQEKGSVIEVEIDAEDAATERRCKATIQLDLDTSRNLCAALSEAQSEVLSLHLQYEQAQQRVEKKK